MNDTSDQAPDFEELLEENRRILERFEKEGVELGSMHEIEFFVSPLSTQDDCKKIRMEFQARYTGELGNSYIYANYHDHFELNVSRVMKITPLEITRFEYLLRQCKKGYDDAEVYWEFAG